MHKIILGSKSPRRQELLANLGLKFDVKVIDFDESYPNEIIPQKVTEFLVNKKLNHFTVNKNEILIVADTIVILENEILEKPKDFNHARLMLKNLSNNKHTVFTSVGIKTELKSIIKTDHTNVFVENITEKEIEYYINNFQVLDKAGSYGIQDWLGIAKISKIEGSFFTVMGFPTNLIYEELCKINPDLF